MSLTKTQANLRLQSIQTVEELRKLIRSIDTIGTGGTTLLWSGTAGLHGPQKDQIIYSERVAASMQKTNPNLRTLANTEVGKFFGS